jgi:hypothetical protein
MNNIAFLLVSNALDVTLDQAHARKERQPTKAFMEYEKMINKNNVILSYFYFLITSHY